MKTLYLCEKPSQGRDIAKQLQCRDRREGCLVGGDTAVSWCIGHLVETARPEHYCPDLKPWRLGVLPIIPQTWTPVVKDKTKAQFTVLKKLIKGADCVVIATDADREGELIAREVLELCQFKGEIKRLWLSALDDASIQKALQDLRPGHLTEPLGQAGLGRQRADWLIGMNLTMAVSVLFGKYGEGVLSVGRVQTPTLKLIVDRDHAIERFVAKDYFELIAEFTTESQERFYAKCVSISKSLCDEEGRCLNKTFIASFAHKVNGQSGNVSHFEDAQKKKSAPLCLSLSQLQKLASSQLGFSAQGTLDLAQALYEQHKALSYPRTDCGYLPESQRQDAPAILAILQKTLPSLSALIESADPHFISPVWNDKKITAHHGIIPTLNTKVMTEKMSSDERALYELVCRYYLAQFLGDYHYAQRSVTVLCMGESFKASSHTPLQPGWKRALSELEEKSPDEADDHLSLLPALQVGQPVQHTEEKILSKQTRPPARFSEGTLIEAMKSIGRQVQDARYQKILKETAGIGTEATRASILETLRSRAYIEKKGKTLISTEKGRSLIAALPPMLCDPMLTAVWEQALDQVSQGQLKLESFLIQQQELLHQMLNALKAQAELRAQPAVVAVASPANRTASAPLAKTDCDLCGKPLVRRLSRQQKAYFWGCSAFPVCRHTVRDQEGRSSTVVHAP